MERRGRIFHRLRYSTLTITLRPRAPIRARRQVLIAGQITEPRSHHPPPAASRQATMGKTMRALGLSGGEWEYSNYRGCRGHGRTEGFATRAPFVRLGESLAAHELWTGELWNRRVPGLLG
jgi:hypothetical protein